MLWVIAVSASVGGNADMAHVQNAHINASIILQSSSQATGSETLAMSPFYRYRRQTCRDWRASHKQEQVDKGEPAATQNKMKPRRGVAIRQGQDGGAAFPSFDSDDRQSKTASGSGGQIASRLTSLPKSRGPSGNQ